MPSRISSSVTDSNAPPLERTVCSAYQPSAGLPMARDLATVWGFTGRMASVPSAKAVATGEQPAACAPDTRTWGSSSSRPTAWSSVEPLRHLGELAARCHRDDHVIGRLPAELLGHLEGECLRPLGVVGPDVHVDEGPRRVLARQLGAQAVDVVVGPLDRHHVAAVDGGGHDLRRLEVVGDEAPPTPCRPGPRGRPRSWPGSRCEAQAATLNPSWRALVSATDTTRSLNDPVGLAVSFLIHSSPSPSSAASRSARTKGVQPAPRSMGWGRPRGAAGRSARWSAGPGSIAARLTDARQGLVVVGHLERAEAVVTDVQGVGGVGAARTPDSAAR